MEYQKKLNLLSTEKSRVKKAAQKLKNDNPRRVDDMFHEMHDTVFKEIDCLKCANCCKTTSPLFRDKDVERLAKHLRMKEQQFIERYLVVDADGDFVFPKVPCPFLMEDNYCSVYEYRPNACREYPHTDRKRVQQVLDLTVKNSEICPAVADIFQKIFIKLKI